MDGDIVVRDGHDSTAHRDADGSRNIVNNPVLAGTLRSRFAVTVIQSVSRLTAPHRVDIAIACGFALWRLHKRTGRDEQRQEDAQDPLHNIISFSW
jgi:hypothetical protein